MKIMLTIRDVQQLVNILKSYKQESEQNHTNPHNILTQVNIGVPDEVRV